MDHMMPGMDGVETTAQIRAMGTLDPYYSYLPIIALTANAISGVKEMFLANGFDDFLSKPIEMSQLATVLERWVPKKKQRRLGLEPREIGTPVNIDARGHDNPLGFKIDALDVRAGLAKAGGNIENFIQNLSIFQQEWFEKIYAIKTAFDSNEFGLFISYIHTLKNAASHVGAAKLSAIADSLENASNKMDIAFIKDNFDDLFSVFHTTLASVRSTMKNYHSDDNGSLEISTLRIELATLKAVLEQRNSESISSAAKLVRPYLHVPGIGSTIENILRYTLTGKYAEALSMINFLLQEKK
jgi:HPt (histidine-containing phosphotransfer) domain-containing protein